MQNEANVNHCWNGILNQGLAQKICNSQKCSSLKENNNISANWSINKHEFDPDLYPYGR